MQSKAKTVEQYMEELPADRQKAMKELRKVINKNLPKGFSEGMGYGMMGWCIPFSMYPKGYHCNPEQPVPFMSIASQKNFIAVYHMGVYASPPLLKWFQEEHAKASPKKLDMGKSCIRYKKPEDIPFELIGKLAAKITPKQWLDMYEQALRR